MIYLSLNFEVFSPIQTNFPDSDPDDLMSWNLCLTDAYRINNDASLQSITQYYADFPQLEYVTKDYNSKRTQYVNNNVIPDEELSAKSDHQRLMERLELYEFVEQKVSGDGNCQFRSISDQIYGSSENHRLVREQVVKQLKSHRELYEGFVSMVDYDEYLKRMSECGEWGDHVTLQAAADSYGVKIFVITSFKDTYYIEIHPQNHRHESNKIIYLSFCAELHYNSIYPRREYPAGGYRYRRIESKESNGAVAFFGTENRYSDNNSRLYILSILFLEVILRFFQF